MKCWNSVFNTQGSRIIISVLRAGAVKIYVRLAAVEVLRKKERLDETQFTTKMDGFLTFIPRPIECKCTYLQVFFSKKIHLVYDQTQGSGAVFFLLYI